jgi:hypothetical protein
MIRILDEVVAGLVRLFFIAVALCAVALTAGILAIIWACLRFLAWAH